MDRRTAGVRCQRVGAVPRFVDVSRHASVRIVGPISDHARRVEKTAHSGRYDATAGTKSHPNATGEDDCLGGIHALVPGNRLFEAFIEWGDDVVVDQFLGT